MGALRKLFFWSFCLLSTLAAVAMTGGPRLFAYPDAPPAKGANERPKLIDQAGSLSQVQCAAFSPDGRLVATGMQGEEVFLWEVENGNKLRRFQGQKGSPLSLDFSCDGRRLLCTTGVAYGGIVLTYSENGPRPHNRAIIWYTANGKIEHTFEVKNKDLRGAVFSSDGKRILGFTDDEAFIWAADNPEGVEVRRTMKKGQRIIAAAFKNGPRLLVRSAKDRVTLEEWDVQRNRVALILGPLKAENLFADSAPAPAPAAGKPEDNKDAIPDYPMAYLAPDGQHVFTYSFQEVPAQIFPDTLATVVLRDAATGKARPFRFVRKNSMPGPFAVSADGRRVLIGYADILTLNTDLKEGYGLTLWDVPTGKPLHTFRGPPIPGGLNATIAASFNSTGRQFIAADADGIARIYDAKSFKKSATLGVWGSSATALAVSPDGRKLYAATIGGDVVEWDLRTGQPQRHFGDGATRDRRHSNSVLAMAVSPDGRWLVTSGYDHQFLLWEIATGVAVKSQQMKPPLFKGPFSVVTAVAFSPDSRLLLTGSIDDKAKASLWRIPSLDRVEVLSGHKNDVAAVAFSPDGRFALTGGGNPDRKAILWDVDTVTPVTSIRGHPAGVAAVAFDPSAPMIATISSFNLFYWERMKSPKLKTRASLPLPTGLSYSSTLSSPRLAFQPFGKLLLTTSYDVATLWDVESLREGKARAIHLRGHDQPINTAAFSPGGRYLVTAGSDCIIVWDTQTGQQLCRLLNPPSKQWLVVHADGRFDAGDLEDNQGLRWVFADDPYRALPPEIFTRDYYEPRILPRLLAGEEFKPVRALAKVNRTQPRVSIGKVIEGSMPDLALVTVEVESAECRSGADDGRVIERAAHDLRLFRNGQLVAQWPTMNPRDELEPDPATPEGLAQWRKVTRLSLDAGDDRLCKTFCVRLPCRKGIERVEFSAYAFNCDRVRSGIARKPYDLPKSIKPKRGKAYLVTMGVTRTQSGAAWSLQFAGDDARRVRDGLKDALKTAGEYDVVPVLLASDAETGEFALAPTKTNLKAVLALLAGRDTPPGWWDGLSERDRKWLRGTLQPAGPNDLLLLSFSCHGITAHGEFYLVPFDIGQDVPEGVVTEALLARCLSSQQLADWLRGVDAGQMALVIDACFSAAAVESGGFKPAPLGDRGFGQLAYDKRMRVLTAAQAKNATYETLGGLLSLALLEGLESRTNNAGDSLTLSKLFAFAVERAPLIFRKKFPGEEGGPVPRPSYFDFASADFDPVLKKLP